EIYAWSNDEIPKFDFAKKVNYDPNDQEGLPLKFFENEDCLIISSLCRTSGLVQRLFHKHNNSADIYPLLDLYYSEVLEIYKHLNKPDSLIKEEFKEYENHEMLEFCDRENLKNQIISSDILPHKNEKWFRYTSEQKKAIAELHQLEK